MSAALDDLLAEQQREGRLPSLSVGVFRGGELAWSGFAGSLDGRGARSPGPDTQYRIGSITKTVVAVAVVRARDAGLLRLRDRLDEHVPGTTFGDSTLAQLLTHTSGLRAETGGPWWERSAGCTWADLLPGLGRTHGPGQRFHYSNVGYAALGQVLEAVHGRPWFEVVRDGILAPLDLTRTSLTPLDDDHARGLAVHPHADLLHHEPHTETGAMAPAGQLWSTVHDLGRFASVLLGETDVLGAASAEEMCHPLAVDIALGEPVGGYGLGVSTHWAGGRRLAGHGGSMPGFLAGLRVDADTGDAVVGFANATSGWAGPTPYLLALDDDPVPAQPWVPGPGEADLVGPWWWGTNGYVLRAGPRGLVLAGAGAGRGTRLRPGRESDLDRAAATNRPAPGEDFWVGTEGYFDGEVLRVVRDDTGAPHHLDLGSFRLTRTPYDPTADLPGGPDPASWH